MSFIFLLIEADSNGQKIFKIKKKERKKKSCVFYWLVY